LKYLGAAVGNKLGMSFTKKFEEEYKSGNAFYYII
jgi:hypothetical protein